MAAAAAAFPWDLEGSRCHAAEGEALIYIRRFSSQLALTPCLLSLSPLPFPLSLPLSRPSEREATSEAVLHRFTAHLTERRGGSTITETPDSASGGRRGEAPPNEEELFITERGATSSSSSSKDAVHISEGRRTRSTKNNGEMDHAYEKQPTPVDCQPNCHSVARTWTLTGLAVNKNLK